MAICRGPKQLTVMAKLNWISSKLEHGTQGEHAFLIDSWTCILGLCTWNKTSFIECALWFRFMHRVLRFKPVHKTSLANSHGASHLVHWPCLWLFKIPPWLWLLPWVWAYGPLACRDSIRIMAAMRRGARLCWRHDLKEARVRKDSMSDSSQPS
jgi:hypothetical protein